ncbi:MAG: hypothetical protein ACJAUP_001040 [Cellvibrionaceae bacterium]|jgi:hypothetical protein
MPYVKRNDDRSIHSIAQNKDDEHQEYLAATESDIANFLSGQKETDLSKHALAESDKEIVRVTEDLINLLISKNIILFTELPDAVQQKLLSREKLRSSLNGVMDNFLDEDELL